MKKQILFITGFYIFFNLNSVAQQTQNDILKNYKAPDFKLRGLTINFEGVGQGSTTDLANTHLIRVASGLYFFQFSNNAKYQGIIQTTMSNSFFLRNQYGDIYYSLNTLALTNVQNRFYFNNEWFWGLHDRTMISLLAEDNSNDLQTTFRPALTLGHGRVEWVHFARKAMDIERLLTQNGHIVELTDENQSLLADKIAQVEFKRFYDLRLGRIYQLEAIDSILQEMGVVNQPSMAYFSRLQDAFLYGNYIARLSGMRHEFGISQGLGIGPNNDEVLSCGFYSFSYYLPQSYIIQHDFNVSLLGGYRINNYSTTQSDFPAWLDAKYRIGIYPSTRTYFSTAVSAGLNYENISGYSIATFINAYYYISPKYRLWADAELRFGDNYSSHDFSHVAITNSNRSLNEISYGFRVGLSYDIF